MKKNILKISLLSLLLFTLLTSVWSQPPPPPPGSHGASTNLAPNAPAAPIGNGTFILFALAAAYAARKLYMLRPSDDTL